MERPYIYFHTPDMPWEPDPAIPGFKRRLLHVHPRSRAHIKQWYLPPAFGPAVGTLPHRHYHRTVTERAYHLAGDFPHWEFKTGADMDGELVVFKRHIFMDRPPLSIHGRFKTPFSQTGSEILYWNTGVGTGLGEPEADTETVTVEFDESGRSDRTNFTEASVFSTLERPWLPHPGFASWRFKPLAGSTEGTPAAVLANIPIDSLAPDNVAIAGNEMPRWLYVVSGDLKVSITASGKTQPFSLREGGFLAWQSEVVLGFAVGPISTGGATVLCVGHDLVKPSA